MSIESGLDDIWSSDFVQKNPKKSYPAYYPTESSAVNAYLNGGVEPNFSGFSKLGRGLCEIEKRRREIEVVDPPPPTSVGRPFQHKADFSYMFNEGPYSDGGGVYEVTGGLRFVITTNMPTPWPAGSKIAQCVWNPTAEDFRGKTHRWSWVRRFPQQTFPQAWQSGILTEFGTTGPPASVGHHIAVSQDARWRVGVEKAPGNAWDFVYGPQVTFDRDIPMTFEIKWSEGSDGWLRWKIDGQVVVERQGATLFGAGSYVRVVGEGFYSALLGRNEVFCKGMTLETLS